METWGQALFGFDGNNAKWRIKTKMLYSILEDLDDQKGVSALDLAALFQGIEGKSSQDEFNQFIQFNLTPAPRAYIQNIYDYLHPFGEQIKNSLKPKH
jgi:hypothetical protein